MYRTIILINAEIKEEDKIVPISPATEKMLSSITKAIQSQNSPEPVEIEIVAAASLWSKPLPHQDENTIYCPLTVELPNFFKFPAQDIYHHCQNVTLLREWVTEKLGYRATTETFSLGDLWLPVILSAKGPVYGEVIAEGAIPNSYKQPFALSDKQRQPLYHLAYQLLTFLEAPSAVYLLQFSCQQEEIVFDRLWPFPAAPALASLKGQQPDLYTCHWYCLTHQPIPEVIVKE
ncbi:hypothetical protein [Gloeocapsa sp. PCC 73106]|uniref:hypothetical protein n=1 Tax=Gloeocapsa sp. PCC 73106 TaxID=102232 RepID=UPI0002AC0BF8|nr:hypothetical protein [Gloeocapsa sp. PCC 73106]ELR97634.1 hypothetical protein GLO73106DRAFT_00014470 [Gloeocapsa sp. PCC 73106]